MGAANCGIRESRQPATFGTVSANPGTISPRTARYQSSETRPRIARRKSRPREAARMPKILDYTGSKLGCVATDIFGKSGRDMLDALESRGG